MCGSVCFFTSVLLNTCWASRVCRNYVSPHRTIRERESGLSATSWRLLPLVRLPINLYTGMLITHGTAAWKLVMHTRAHLPKAAGMKRRQPKCLIDGCCSTLSHPQNSPWKSTAKLEGLTLSLPHKLSLCLLSFWQYQRVLSVHSKQFILPAEFQDF